MEFSARSVFRASSALLSPGVSSRSSSPKNAMRLSGRIHLDDNLSQRHSNRLSAGKTTTFASKSIGDRTSSFASGYTDSDRETDVDGDELHHFHSMTTLSSDSSSGKHLSHSLSSGSVNHTHNHHQARLSTGNKQRNSITLHGSGSCDGIGIGEVRSSPLLDPLKHRPLPPLPSARPAAVSMLTCRSSSPVPHCSSALSPSSSASSITSLNNSAVPSPAPSPSIAGSLADESVEFPEEEDSLPEDESTAIAHISNRFSTNKSKSPVPASTHTPVFVPMLNPAYFGSMDSADGSSSSAALSPMSSSRPLSVRSTSSSISSSRPNSGRLSSRFMARPFRCASPTDRNLVTNPAEALKMKLKKSASNDIYECSTAPLTGRR